MLQRSISPSFKAFEKEHAPPPPEENYFCTSADTREIKVCFEANDVGLTHELIGVNRWLRVTTLLCPKRLGRALKSIMEHLIY